ncbi:MAG: amidohydrolase [Defluviicoccus sp.]|nr:amidohydrolase [Defluviicoccus sp.]MDE0275266.1 amidohydrolase [Defluviicoccus sp.]
MAARETILLRDAMVLSLDRDDVVHDRANVVVSGGEISAIGPDTGLGEGRFDRVIEGRGRLLAPGFVNAHTHSPANLIQGTGDRLSHPAFMWMNQAYTAHRTAREVYVSAMLGCIQMLLSGTTAVLDHFPGQACTMEDVDAVMEAYRDSGMRAVLGLRFYDAAFADILPDDDAIPREVAAEIEALDPLKPVPLEEVRALTVGAVQRWHGFDGRLAVFPAPSNPERCSDAALVMCGELAERYDLGIHTHLLESRVQAEIAQRKYGCTMVEHLDRLGLLDRRLSLAHSIWLDDDDIGRLADGGSVVVHNPESNLKIGAGTAPIPAMMAKGVKIALGTDGAGTNDNLIMHEALRLAAILHRPALPERGRWPGADDVLRMATAGGAAAILQSGTVGSIEVGKRADLVLYRLDAPWWVPVNDPSSQMVFAENGSSVETVLVDGRVVVEDGRIVAFDAESILEEAAPMMSRILERNRRLYALAGRMAELFP